MKSPAGEGRGRGDSTHRGWRCPRHVEWEGELAGLELLNSVFPSGSVSWPH